ncbi:Major facilitator superfamily domain-containing protein 5, partial [Fusarium austroafricanum]
MFGSYSLAERWVEQGFDKGEGGLSLIYSTMALTKGFVAMGCGVVAQMLVNLSGSQVAPFLASIVCLSIAQVMISRSWVENAGPHSLTSTRISSIFALLGDPALLVCAFALSVFEGSIHVMVYSWPDAIMSARTQARKWGNPPFGLIYADFMAALTIGSF